jgi:hypothetical protein
MPVKDSTYIERLETRYEALAELAAERGARIIALEAALAAARSWITRESPTAKEIDRLLGSTSETKDE